MRPEGADRCTLVIGIEQSGWLALGLAYLLGRRIRHFVSMEAEGLGCRAESR